MVLIITKTQWYKVCNDKTVFWIRPGCLRGTMSFVRPSIVQTYCRCICYGRGSCIWSGKGRPDKSQSDKRRSFLFKIIQYIWQPSTFILNDLQRSHSCLDQLRYFFDVSNLYLNCPNIAMLKQNDRYTTNESVNIPNKVVVCIRQFQLVLQFLITAV